MNEKSNQAGQSAENEHVFHMWEPLPFSVKPGYDYRRTGLLARGCYHAIRVLVSIILALFNRFAFGFRITGRNHLKALGDLGFVSVCNHVHPMDCTMVGLALLPKRLYYVSLARNFKIPVIRHLIRFLGAVPLADNPCGVKELFHEMKASLEIGDAVQMYPEGILYPYYDGLREFKPGAFYLAVSANVPVLPMLITYEQPRGLMRLYKKKPCLTLNILPAIYPVPGANRKVEACRLMELTKQSMQDRPEQDGHPEYEEGHDKKVPAAVRNG